MSALPQASCVTGSQQLLASVWQRNLPIMRERFATLSDLAQTGSDGMIPESARIVGSEIAHKLAGSLGMFGYLQGTEVARALEHLLDSDHPVALSDVLALTVQLHQAVPI